MLFIGYNVVPSLYIHLIKTKKFILLNFFGSRKSQKSSENAKLNTYILKSFNFYRAEDGKKEILGTSKYETN